jgi:hypothetical protein
MEINNLLHYTSLDEIERQQKALTFAIDTTINLDMKEELTNLYHLLDSLVDELTITKNE